MQSSAMVVFSLKQLRINKKLIDIRIAEKDIWDEK